LVDPDIELFVKDKANVGWVDKFLMEVVNIHVGVYKEGEIY